MTEPDHVAIGTWSGGRFMRFGEPIDEEQLVSLLRPGEGIRTVLTADVYGEGEADRLLARALNGLPRDSYFVAGAVGHDFYEGERQGAKGFPRFTQTRTDHGGYLRMATERSLERCGLESFDLLLLHNPDREGYTSESVWEGMRALRDEGLAQTIGVAPGPANGFTLDLISCFERFGERIDWAMVILNPLEPWPGELGLGAAATKDVRVMTRVVDYGGLFHDDVLPGHAFGERDHRTFRPAGWVEAGWERMQRMRPIAERHGLTMLQLACAWNLAHESVAAVVPTLIQEAGHEAKPIEAKRAELAVVPAGVPLTPEEVEAIRAVGDNTGSMVLKGGSPDHDGEPRPDRWELDDRLAEVAARWGIDPARDLAQSPVPAGSTGSPAARQA